MDLTDNPELLATFVEEARERLDSLASGLLTLEAGPASRSAVGGLFRDAHTLKGSARMLGLSGIVELAHVAEDLLAAVRDRRITPNSDLTDLLLAAVDGMGRSLPAAENPLGDDDRQALREAMLAALAGKPTGVPRPRGGAPTPPSTPAPAPAAPAPAIAAVETVRVAVPRIHDLLDSVGEAEVDARRVERVTNELTTALAAALRGGAQHVALEALLPAAAALRELVEDHAARVVRLRADAMSLAMVPLSRLVTGFPRLVRDLATRTGKHVTLVLEGEDVELDKRVLDTIGEALGHLITNAVDHGCEASAVRQAAGKPESATVWVRARASGASVIIEVADDGAGIDRPAVRAAAIAAGLVASDAGGAESNALDDIFAPSLSTRQTVTESSGRGVGLDVVRSTVEGLGGQITVASTPGEGTCFTLTLPVSLGILRCLLCRVGGERYAIPLPSVSETCSLRGGAAATISHLAGSDLIIREGAPIPLLDLAEVLGSFAKGRARRSMRKPSAALLTTAGRRPLAWAVDGLEGEADLVVTDLGAFLSAGSPHSRPTTRAATGTGGVAGASGVASAVTGASILDDGSIVCLLDLRTLASVAGASVRYPRFRHRASDSSSEPASPASDSDNSPLAPRPLRILVVEDSVGVRELERSLLVGAGYEVDTAVDGLDGVARLSGDRYDLVVTDIEMPGMDGLELTRTVRATPGWQAVPVVVMTSRDGAADQRAGMDAGADAYLHKSDFSAADLLGTVARLLGGFA